MLKKKIQVTFLDLVLILTAAGLFGYLGFQLLTGIDYNWNWSVIPQYIFRYDTQKGYWVPNLLMQGFLATIRLSFWAAILAVFLGTVMAVFRVSKSLFRRMVGRTYVELIRNTPPLVLVFIVYFFVSDQIMTILGIDHFVRGLPDIFQSWLGVLFAPPARFSGFLAALLTLAMYEGAYVTEILRSGIESIEKGQWEASDALGLSRGQQLRFIILPQATRRILPPLAGQMISTIKDSAIVSVISIQELTFQGMELMASTYLTFEIWITVTALYFVLTFSCSMAVNRLELRMQKYDN